VWPSGNIAITLEYKNLYCIIDVQEEGNWLKDKIIRADMNGDYGNYSLFDEQVGNCIIYRGEYLDASDWYIP